MIGSNQGVPSDYRLSRPLLARLLGVLLAALGIALFLLTVAVAVLGLPGTVLTVGVVVVAVAAVLIALAAFRNGFVVRLDDAGYRVRFVRGVGVARSRWTDVEDVVATTVAGERCIVLRLRDGRASTIPVRLLAARPEDFVTDLQAHLNRGHGYRRIR